MLQNLPLLLEHPQVIALGECGLDALRGALLEEQERIFRHQIRLAEAYNKPVTLHIVRTFDRLLRLHKELHPTTQWTVHGFRGKPPRLGTSAPCRWPRPQLWSTLQSAVVERYS